MPHVSLATMGSPAAAAFQQRERHALEPRGQHEEIGASQQIAQLSSRHRSVDLHVPVDRCGKARENLGRANTGARDSEARIRMVPEQAREGLRELRRALAVDPGAHEQDQHRPVGSPGWTTQRQEILLHPVVDAMDATGVHPPSQQMIAILAGQYNHGVGEPQRDSCLGDQGHGHHDARLQRDSSAEHLPTDLLSRPSALLQTVGESHHGGQAGGACSRPAGARRALREARGSLRCPEPRRALSAA